jgi:hypothetical protein
VSDGGVCAATTDCTAHHHAQVLGFDDHSYPKRAQCFLKSIANLCGEPLLHLQSTCADVNDARNLRQPRDIAVGNIGHVCLAIERDHVVLTQAVHLDVFDDHHLLHLLGEDCAANDFHRIVTLTLREKLHRFGDALGCLQEAFAIGVFTNQRENFAV